MGMNFSKEVELTTFLWCLHILSFIPEIFKKMIKLMADNFHNFKCGEVYCLSTERYDICCCLCGVKFELIEFPKHFREHLSSEISRNTEECTSPIATRTRQKNQIENDPLLSNERNFNIKPEGIDEEEVDEEELNWNDHFESDDIAIDINVAEQPVQLEENVESKEVIENPEFKIRELGAKTIAYGDEDDDVDIGIENNEWLHEKYSYEDVVTDNDDTEEVEDLEIDIKFNIFESDDSDGFDKDDIERFDTKIKKTNGDYELEPPVPCEYCKRMFSSKIGLKIHTTAVHDRKDKSETKPLLEYKCDVCEMKFSTEKSLVNHKYKHTGIFCDVCGKTFSQIGNMERHRVRHSGIKTIPCELCEMSFFTERERKAHMMRHTGILPLICEICGKRCRDHGVLTAHMRRHTNTRPAKCNVCGKSFFSQYDVNVHSVTHTTERPFKCDICGSTFQLKKSLRVHKKIHSKDRHHVCKICDKAFAQSSGLQAHMRVHDAVTNFDNSNKYFENGYSTDDVASVAAQASSSAIVDVSVAQDGPQWGLGLLKF